MGLEAPRSILEKTFRANPNYELVPLNRFPRAYRLFWNPPVKSAWYGILRPRKQSALGTKKIYPETGRLYLELRQPRRIPPKFVKPLGSIAAETIAKLVLDGVLEMQNERSYVSGADAYPLLYGNEPLALGSGILAQLSVAAVQYGQALGINEALKLTSRLYFYNTQPFSAAWQSKLAAADAFDRFLNLKQNYRVLQSSRGDWKRAFYPSKADGWLFWKSKDSRAKTKSRKPRFKLYVSPKIEAVSGIFGEILSTLTHSPARSFKVASDLHGLLRPDKIVAYFSSFEQLKHTSACLLSKLSGVPAQGVPFTAELAPDGLLSWGVDPPRQECILDAQWSESWRLWVATQLAVALSTSNAKPSSRMQPWEFALRRLHLEGVDTSSWSPTEKFWPRTPFANES